jgi:peptide/nickel transport system substrate-binding protein
MSPEIRRGPAARPRRDSLAAQKARAAWHVHRLVSILAVGVLALGACAPAGGGPTPAGRTPDEAASTAGATTSAASAGTPVLVGQPTSAPGVPGPTVAPTGGLAKPGGRVVVGDVGDIKSLSPILVNDPASDFVTSRIYASLLGVDPKTGESRPNLAAKFDLSPDGKTVTFQLRDGLKFSDGSPLTGGDFKFSVEALLRSKKTTRKNNVDQIAGARQYAEGSASDISGIGIDGNTITVTLNNSFCPALAEIGGVQIIPQSVFGKYLDPSDAAKNLDDAPENNAPPVTSGAFTFNEWASNDHVTLDRNDNYWHKANLDQWVYKPYPNQDALTAALREGEVDLTQLDPRELPDLQNDGSIQIFKYLNPGYTFIGWNQQRGGKEFLQDKAVRKALTYAFDVQPVIDKVLLGEGVKMVGQIPPMSWAYDASGLNPYGHDPDYAEKLLQDDGWTKGDDGIYAKNGQKLAFSIMTNSGNSARETFIQMAAEQYKRIGVSVEPKTEPFDALVDRLNQSKDPQDGDQGGHDFDAVVIGWSLSADPDMYSIWDSNSTHTGESNWIDYKNPDLDKAIDDSRTNCGQVDRKDAFKRANQILNDEQPYNFGFAANVLLGVNRRILGIDPGPYARWGQAAPETWWVSQ